MHVDYHCFLDRTDLWSAIAELARERSRRGGVYRIHAFREDGSRDWTAANLVAVNRVAEPDPLGRLFIGSAEVLTAGFITLWRSLTLASGQKDSDGPGQTYRESPMLRRRFPRLCFTLRFDPRPGEAQAEELAAYVACFGELPPLNAALLTGPAWSRFAATKAPALAAIA